MATNAEPTLYLNEFYRPLLDLFVTELVAEQLKLTSLGDMTLAENKALGRLETNYHVKTRDNADLLAHEPLHNLLPPTHKLLTDRMLELLYGRAMEKYMVLYPAKLEILNKFVLAPGLNKLVYYMILSAPEVCGIMNPIVQTLITYVKSQISRLDEIPYIEQKTQEWLRVRADMISASVCGYFDAIECGCGIYKEYSQVKEKAGLAQGSKIGWHVGSIKHGMTFEDMSGALYNLFNDVTSKEYGILPDNVYPIIGASPDGIITDVTSSDSWINLRKMGRMREIKNPTDRLINDKVPSYYYWQMIQQMYVCKLPLCDFIQTSFVYPNMASPQTFLLDTLDVAKFKLLRNWTELERYMGGGESVVLTKLKWLALIGLIGRDDLLTKLPLSTLDTTITRTVIDNWIRVSSIPLENINKSGEIKGVLYCFTKPDTIGGTDFEVIFMDPGVPITTVEQIQAFYELNSADILSRGFTYETTYYWSCKKYLDYEVEYNQMLYEGRDSVLSRLLDKWSLIASIRAEPDMDIKQAIYKAYYPADVPKAQKDTYMAKNVSWRSNTVKAKGNVQYDLS